MSKKQMSKEAAARIQSKADKTGDTSGFKERAQSAASKHGDKK